MAKLNKNKSFPSQTPDAINKAKAKASRENMNPKMDNMPSIRTDMDAIRAFEKMKVGENDMMKTTKPKPGKGYK
jgi:hypothetical protein